MELILGSQSPRRLEILNYFTLPFRQISPDYDEDQFVFGGDPIAHVNKISQGKAHSLAHLFPEATLLTADTMVYKEGKMYGKARDKNEAIEFLKEFQNQWHSVYTSLTIKNPHLEFQAVEETRVLFNPLTEQQILSYLDHLPYIDKAGSYMIQGTGSIAVHRIEGCYYNVMGLPITLLRSLLLKVGIDLWSYLK